VRDVLLKFSRHSEGKVIEVTEELYGAYTQLKEVKKSLAALDEQKEALEEKLKVAFGDAEALSYGGHTIATFKAPKPSMKFDAKAFTTAHPELAQEFSTEVQGNRRFLLK